MMWTRYSMKAWWTGLAWVVVALTGVVQGDDNYYEGPGDPSRSIASWRSDPLWTLGWAPTPNDLAVFDHSRLDPGGSQGHQGVYLGDFWHVDVEPFSVREPGGVATIGALLVSSGSWTLNFGPNFQGANWSGEPSARGGLVMQWLAVEGGVMNLREIGAVDTPSGKASVVIGHDLLVNGSGTLNIADGSTVRNVTARVGASNGAVGVVTLDGVAVNGIRSTWNSSGGLEVGVSGQGILSITNGSLACSGYAVIGYNSTGLGVVTVDGITADAPGRPGIMRILWSVTLATAR